MKFTEFVSGVISDNPYIVYKGKTRRLADLPSKIVLSFLKDRWAEVGSVEGTGETA